MRSVGCLLLLCCACGVGPIPTARIDLEPASLCEGDTEQAVIMSASRSQAPDGTPDGLRYAWSVSSAPTETLRGADVCLAFSQAGPGTNAQSSLLPSLPASYAMA